MKYRRAALAALLLVASGCGKFGFDGTVTVPEGQPFAQVEFPPPQQEKKVRLAVSAEEPVAVYVVAGDDMGDAVARLRARKEPRRVLAREAATRESTLEVTLEVTLPANRGFVVFLSRAGEGGQAVPVKLSLK